MWACYAVLVCNARVYPALVGNVAFACPLLLEVFLKILRRGSCAKTPTCCIIVHRAREYPTNRLIVSTLAEGA